MPDTDMLAESLQIIGRPNRLFEEFLGSDQAVDRLLDENKKQPILDSMERELVQFSEKETADTVRLLLGGLSRNNQQWDQRRRSAILTILSLIDFSKLNPYQLTREYLDAVATQNRETHPFGSINSLIEAGFIIAPHFPSDEKVQQEVDQAWERIASRFTGEGRRYIDNQRRAIVDLIGVSSPQFVDLRSYRLEEAVRAEEIERRRNYLLSQGFSEHRVDSLTAVRPTLFEPMVVAGHLTLLRGLGFTDPNKMVSTLPAILSYSEENIKGKIALLEELRFPNPVKMITTLPAILALSEENIKGKIALLRREGFTDPVKMITTLPAILSYSEENIKGKIALLRELGFTDPVKMITTLPTILAYSEENIKGKIALLEELRFPNPVKMITTLPAILAYREGNITGKIALLRREGFTDPVKMITTHPAILAYSEENIKRRILLFSRLIELYDLNLDPITIMEKELGLFSTKIDKILVLVRIIREYRPRPQEIIHDLISTVVRNNLENTLVALSYSLPDKETLEDLKDKLLWVKEQNWTREQKRKIIEVNLHYFPKIYKRYLKGYPK